MTKHGERQVDMTFQPSGNGLDPVGLLARFGVPRGEAQSLLQLDALFGPVVLEDYVDGLDDLLARIGLAMDDDFVLQSFGPRNLHHVFLGKAVVPTAIPSGQIIRVFLKRVRQLSTGQLLNIEIAVAVGV